MDAGVTQAYKLRGEPSYRCEYSAHAPSSSKTETMRSSSREALICYRSIFHRSLHGCRQDAKVYTRACTCASVKSGSSQLKVVQGLHCRPHYRGARAGSLHEWACQAHVWLVEACIRPCMPTNAVVRILDTEPVTWDRYQTDGTQSRSRYTSTSADAMRAAYNINGLAAVFA